MLKNILNPIKSLQMSMVASAAGGATPEAYIGTFLYKYKEGNAYRIKADDTKTMSWECVEGDEVGANGTETPQRFKISKNVFFATWVEKAGVIVSQVLDFDNMKVYATVVVGADRYVLEGTIVRE